MVATVIPPMIVFGTFLAFAAGLPSPSRTCRLLIVEGFGIAAIVALLLGLASLIVGGRAAAFVAIIVGSLETTLFILFGKALI